jgi:glycosyltransferase involved in cell wall biosynthesis
MRAGADIAQGKYVTFLDDDDEYLPSKIEKQVALFEALPEDYGIVYCWMSYFNFDEQDKVIRIHKTQLKGFVGDIAPSKPLITGTPTMLIRRNVFEEFGGTFNDNIGFLMSDWELCARICQKYKVDYVPESLVSVYINHGHARLTTDFYSEKAKKGILFYTHFLNEFKEAFERHPEYANYHYYYLSRCYAKLKQRKTAYKYYRLMSKTSATLNQRIKSIVGIIIGK